MYHLAKTKARKPRKKRDTRRKSRNARKTRHTRKPHKTQQKRKPRKSRNSRRRKRRHRGGATQGTTQGSDKGSDEDDNLSAAARLDIPPGTVKSAKRAIYGEPKGDAGHEEPGDTGEGSGSLGEGEGSLGDGSGLGEGSGEHDDEGENKGARSGTMGKGWKALKNSLGKARGTLGQASAAGLELGKAKFKALGRRSSTDGEGDDREEGEHQDVAAATIGSAPEAVAPEYKCECDCKPNN